MGPRVRAQEAVADLTQRLYFCIAGREQNRHRPTARWAAQAPQSYAKRSKRPDRSPEENVIGLQWLCLAGDNPGTGVNHPAAAMFLRTAV